MLNEQILFAFQNDPHKTSLLSQDSVKVLISTLVSPFTSDFIAAFYVNPFHRAFAYKAVPHCAQAIGYKGIKIPHCSVYRSVIF